MYVLRCLTLRDSHPPALTFTERDALTQMATDDDAWEDESPPILPHGEEGMFFSAAGGEHKIWEEFFQGEWYILHLTSIV